MGKFINMQMKNYYFNVVVLLNFIELILLYESIGNILQD